MIAIVGLFLAIGTVQGRASVPVGARVALYEYVIRAYGQSPLNPLADGVSDSLALNELIAEKLSSPQPQAYVRIDKLRVVHRTPHGLMLSVRIGLDRAKPGAGTAYKGLIQLSEQKPGWHLTSVQLDRFDDVGLDAASEIAAYRTAISRCPKNAVIVLPLNTSDRVFLPLKRSSAGLTRQDPETGACWDVSITMDHLGRGIRSGTLEVFRRSGHDFGHPTMTPFRFLGTDRQVSCQVLSTEALPVSSEVDLLVDAAGPESRPVFVDSSQEVLNSLKAKGIRAVPGSVFKKDEDYVATGFMRIGRPFVRWFAKDHALVSLSTYFRPAGGDVTYSSGGPYELRWFKGKLLLKRLIDQWAGE